GTASGKSTVAALLTRFYDVDAGSASIDGIDVRDLRLDELRRAVGLVFSETFLFTDTVRANIAYARPEATALEVERAARLAGAHDFVQRLPNAYDTLLGGRGYSVSGGPRQRPAIPPGIPPGPDVVV